MTGFGAEIEQLFDRVLGDVAGAGDQADLAFERFLAALQHLLRVINAAIAGCFGTNQRAAPVESLARKHAGELIAKALVLSEEEADLAAAHADVAGGHVGVWSDVALEFGHKALAEAHDFAIALALGIEVRAALASAHGQGGQRVLEDLLEGEKLEDSKIDRGMEAQSALVGPDGAVHLDAEAAVDLHVAVVVKPWHAEHDDALRLHHALKNAGRTEFRMFIEDGAQGFQNLLHGLMELRFGGILRLHLGKYFFDVASRILESGRLRGSLQLASVTPPGLKDSWRAVITRTERMERSSGKQPVRKMTRRAAATQYTTPLG